MPLDFQTVNVDFTGGLDKKTNEKLVVPSKLTELENGWFAEDGTLTPAHGSTARTQAILGGGTLTAADALATFRDELLRIADYSLYAYTADGWVRKGSERDAQFTSVEQDQLVSVTRASVTRACQATVGTHSLVAWIEANGEAPGLHVLVRDEATGASVIPDTVVDASASLSHDPRCASVSTTHMAVFWREGTTNVKSVLWAASSPGSLGSAVTLVSDCGGLVDACETTEGDMFVAYRNTSSDLAVLRVSTAGAVTASAAHPMGVGTRICVAQAASGRFIVLYGANAQAINADLSVFTPEFAALPLDGENGLATADGSTFHAVCSDLGLRSPPTGTINPTLYASTLDESGALSASAVLAYGVRMLSLPVALEGRVLLPVATQHSSTRFTGILLDVADGRAVSVFAQESLRARLFGHSVVLGGEAAILCPTVGRLLSFFEEYDVSQVGVSRIRVRFADPANLSRVQLPRGVWFAGGLPLYYDGASLVEAGFNVEPFRPEVTATGSGSLSTGSYQWVAVFEWLDEQGQLHRSSSVATDSTAVTSGQSKTLRVYTQPLTRRTGTRSNIAVHLYRTEANGTIFYRATSVSTPELNDTAASYVDIVDSASDASIIDNEALYTTGGVLENIAPPPHRFAALVRDRLFLGGLPDGRQYRYSKPLVDGDAPAFHEALSGSIPPGKGNLTAFADLDERIVMFAERGIFVIGGDPADALGLNSTLTEPQDLLSSVGCADWRSVVSTELGLFFLDNTGGISLLTRGLQVVPIGEEVRELSEAGTFARAVLVPHLKQVRFLFSGASGFQLVYDLLHNQWSTLTGRSSVDGVMFGDTFVRANGETGKVLDESASVETEDDTAFDVYAVTAWVKLAGLQGFQRVQRALLLGDYGSPTSLVWDVGYDYKPFDVANRLSPSLADATYTAGQEWQLERVLAKQKCEAVRFGLRFTPSGGDGSGVTLTSMALRVGMKKGTYRRLPAARRIG